MFKLVTENLSNENDLLSLSLDEIARTGAKRLLIQALELEVQDYIKRCSHLKDDSGHRVVVRNGKSRSRKVTLGSGSVQIKTPRINDKRDQST